MLQSNCLNFFFPRVYRIFQIHLISFFFFLYLFLAALGLCCCTWAFSSCSERGYSSLWCTGFSLRWLLFVAEHGLQVRGLQQLWLTGSRAHSQQLWHTGLVAPQHVGSSRTRARACVPCIGRRIPNHCATREVLI